MAATTLSERINMNNTLQPLKTIKYSDMVRYNKSADVQLSDNELLHVYDVLRDCATRNTSGKPFYIKPLKLPYEKFRTLVWIGLMLGAEYVVPQVNIIQL